MAINLVRKPSEIPNINNYDDYRMFRYATGGYNGVIEKYGNECDYEINGNTFKIKSGEIVIDGVQSKIDASGVGITVDNVTGTEYYTVYCEVNLTIIDNQKSEIKATKSTVNYPVIEKGDDLTQNQAGIARLELYRFQVNNGVISNVIQVFKFIEYGNAKHAENAKIAEFASNDTSKGTIEERLTSLGFKEGSASLNVTAQSYFSEDSFINCFRQGNYVFLNVGLFMKNLGTWQSFLNTEIIIAVLPIEFRPKINPSLYVETGYGTDMITWIRTILGTTYVCRASHSLSLRIFGDGRVVVRGDFSENYQSGWTAYNFNTSYNRPVYIGYEANPL